MKQPNNINWYQKFVEYTVLDRQNKDNLLTLKMELTTCCQIIDAMEEQIQAQTRNFRMLSCHWFYAFCLLKDLDHRGSVTTIAYYKFIKRALVTRAFGSDDPLPTLKRLTSKNGSMPKHFNILFKLFEFGSIGKRMAITVSNLFILAYAPIDTNSSAIEDTFAVPLDSCGKFEQFLQKCKFIKAIPKDYFSKYNFFESGYHSLNGGPNGPSIANYLLDLNYLVHRDNSTFCRIIDMYILQGSRYLESITECLAIPYLSSSDSVSGPMVSQISERGRQN